MFSLAEVTQIKVVCTLWIIALVYTFFFDRYVSKKFTNPAHVIAVFIVGIVCITFIVFVALRFVVIQ